MNRTRRKRGIALILTALMLVFLIPLVGLTVDAGVLFSLKAKAQAAVDAAAIAAARNLSTGMTIEEQAAYATERAEKYLAANFPEGFLESGKTVNSERAVTVTVTEEANRRRKVRVALSVEAPVFFMRYLGWNRTTKEVYINTVGEATRRDVNVMLVMDRSGSLQSAGACDDLELAAIGFVDMFANTRDYIGLVTYGGSSKVDYPPTKDFLATGNSIIDKLSAIDPGGCAGWTNTAQGMWQGYQQSVTIDEPGAINAIVLFTDGNPNTLTADWPVKTLATTTSPTGTSHCWDWAANKRYNQPGWNPVTQRYRGFVAQQFTPSTSRDGIRGHVADNIPVTGDPGRISNPVGYESLPAKSSGDDCYFRSSGADVYLDVPYIPSNDYWGNPVLGWKAVNTFPTGHPYAGKAIFNDYTHGQHAAINAVDNAAARIRNKELDANLPMVMYVIGLGGVGEAEGELMQRVANVPESSAYDPTTPEGMYVYAPTPADLQAAFAKIAGEILRINE